MEFAPTFSNFSLFYLCLFMLSLIVPPIKPAYASDQDCDFPAVFNFGDSNSDTGGLSAAFITPPPPNGQTFFHMPAGRWADGRLIIDFIASNLEKPFLSAYLDSLGSNFRHGANFATAASTIRLPGRVMPTKGGFSPFYLEVQFLQFLQFKIKSQMIWQQGGKYAELLPKEEYFSKALYTIDIGQNDLMEGFLSKATDEVNASVPDIVAQLSTQVMNIYKLGGRSFWIHNTGPIGCLAYTLTYFPSPKDNAGCSIPHNEVAQHFNRKLKEAIVELRKDLPLAAVTYVDVYSVKYSLFTQPKKHGFVAPLVVCCGYGEKYNYTKDVMCGEKVILEEGNEIVVGSCEDPSKKVNWDGVHYTDAANKLVFERISTGDFSDPPIPLRKACFRDSNSASLSQGSPVVDEL